jgi:hypothetical protein
MIGNLYSVLSGSTKSTKWFEAVVSLIIAEFIAGTIHGVCVTSCFLISIGITYELHKLANEGGEDTTESDRFVVSSKRLKTKK